MLWRSPCTYYTSVQLSLTGQDFGLHAATGVVDHQTAIFSPENTIYDAIQNVIGDHFVNEVLFVVKSDCPVFERDEHVVLRGCLHMFHLFDRADLRRHSDRPIFLAFEVKALDSVVHPGDDDGFFKFDEADWLRLNRDLMVDDLAFAHLIDAPITTSHENAILYVESTSREYEDRN